MSQSPSSSGASGLHVAIIMDGNGRWAEARGWPRIAGHRQGAETVRRMVEASRRRGVGTLTLYAFSSDNWSRPSAEVSALMALFRQHLAAETPRCIANGIRLSVIGRRDRLAPEVVAAIEAAEEATGGQRGMHLRIALDYSARDAIAMAAERARALPPGARCDFAALLGEVIHDPGPAPDVDLLIRSGGEQRISDFLLWECAYAELWFTGRMWPDFDAADLDAAISEFAGRERRFGRVSAGDRGAAAAGN
jgi:undecaprenyl diphosphate synthase